ncbi:MAG: hypothetical protein ACRED8_08720 [Caulobacteraceae bacterium]
MRMVTDRAVFTVEWREGLWMVEHGGDYFGHSPDKEVAKAAAAKRMRQVYDSGRACQIRVTGEHGFYGAK